MKAMVSKYRWELLLVVGIPLIAWMLVFPSLVFRLMLGYILCPLEGTRCAAGSPFAIDHFLTFYWSVVPAGLLFLFYRAVNRSRPGFLPLVWRCEVFFAIASAPAWLVVAAIAPESRELEETATWLLGYALAAAFLRLPVLLWFTRQTSSYGSAHAFFLVLLVGIPAPYFGVVWLQPTQLGLLASEISAAIGLLLPLNIVTMCVMAWLLAKFPSWDSSVRRLAIIGMVAARALGVAILIAIVLTQNQLGFTQSTQAEIFLILAIAIVDAALALVLALPLVRIVTVRSPAAADIANTA